MTHPDLSGLFHTGMVVDNVETAMSTFSKAFGYHWAEPIELEAQCKTREGILPRHSIATYSLEGPHHIELIQQIDDTAWKTASGGPKVHHLGFWVDDLEESIERLGKLGFQLEVEDVSGALSYHYQSGMGLYIELVHARAREQFDEWWDGKPLRWERTSSQGDHSH